MTAGPPVLVEIHQDEVLTGEAVALDVQPLGFFLRVLGAFIDAVISILLLIGGIWLLGSLALAGALSTAGLQISVIVLVVLILVVVPTVVETTTRGRSIGRLAVGGRIVRNDGGAAGFRQAFIRALAGVLEIYFTFGAIAM